MADLASGSGPLFTDPDPEEALSDGPNSWPMDLMSGLVEDLLAIDAAVKSRGYMETRSGTKMP